MKTTKPGKQRKRMSQDPLNKRYKRFSAPLATKLKQSHHTNSVPVRAGDTVKIMRGDRKGFEGKVSQVNRKKYRILVEGATREKVDGTTTLIPIHPSKVVITRLNLDDKWRKRTLKRKGAAEKVKVTREKTVEEEKGQDKKKEAEKKKTLQKTAKKSGGK